MIASANGLVPSAEYLEQEVCAHIRNQWPLLDIHWQTLDPIIDSSQASMQTWADLGQHIVPLIDLQQPIVILHGTDTMAYASSALAMMLPQHHPTVVLTGSQQPWLSPKSDAPDNVLFAVQCALTAAADTVYLAFNNTVFMGSHVSKFDALNPNAFLAPQGIYSNPKRHKTHQNLYPWRPQHIEILTCFPGTQYNGLRALLATSPEVLIVKSLGVGNIPNVEAFKDALKDAPLPLLINHSQCLIAAPTHSTYGVNHELKQYPWISPGTLTLEALICKLHLLPSTPLTPEDVNQFLLTPIDHELPPAG